MQYPKISVIMAVYNGEKYLNESITSILRQTFHDFEFIIIDDGSSDASLNIIQKFARGDPRIKFLRNRKNQGLTYSLNRGIKLAKSKYIARQDADDLSLPRRLAFQYAYLENNPSVFLVGSSAIIINPQGQEIGRYQKENNPQKVSSHLPRRNQILHSSITFHNQNIFYREKFQYAQDYDLFLRLLTAAKILTNLPHFLIKYRYNPGSASFLHNQKQKYFARQAREFYHQRRKKGQDQYEDWEEQKFLNQIEEKEKRIWPLKLKHLWCNLKNRKWKPLLKIKI